MMRISFDENESNEEVLRKMKKIRIMLRIKHIDVREGLASYTPLIPGLRYPSNDVLAILIFTLA